MEVGMLLIKNNLSKCSFCFFIFLGLILSPAFAYAGNSARDEIKNEFKECIKEAKEARDRDKAKECKQARKDAMQELRQAKKNAKRDEGRGEERDDRRDEGRGDERDDRRDEGRGDDRDDRRDEGRGDERDERRDDGRGDDRDDRRDEGRGNERDDRRDEGRGNERDDRGDEGRSEESCLDIISGYAWRTEIDEATACCIVEEANNWSCFDKPEGEERDACLNGAASSCGDFEPNDLIEIRH